MTKLETVCKRSKMLRWCDIMKCLSLSLFKLVWLIWRWSEVRRQLCMFPIVDSWSEAQMGTLVLVFVCGTVTKKRKRKIWRAWNCCGRRSIAGHATHEEHKKGYVTWASTSRYTMSCQTNIHSVGQLVLFLNHSFWIVLPRDVCDWLSTYITKIHV